MPELGQVSRAGDRLLIYLPRRSPGRIHILGAAWTDVCPQGIDGIDSLADGTVIDHEALLRRGELVVLREPPHRMDDATLEALDREADAMGGLEE